MTDLNSEMNSSRMPIVRMKDNEAVASSRDVAEFFEKRHDDVLRAIRTLNCSDEFNARNFAVVEYVDAKGERRSSVDMTRDGFSFVGLGFTGPKAGRFKEAYIAAFNAMEDELRRRPPAIPDYSDPMVMLGVYEHLKGQVAARDQKIAVQETKLIEMQPKVEAHDRIAEFHGSLCVTDAAKALQIGRDVLKKWMLTNEWVYRRPGGSQLIAYQAKIAAGLLETKVYPRTRRDGTEVMETQARITPKGLTRLAHELPAHYWASGKKTFARAA